MKFLVFQHIACEHPGIFRSFLREAQIEWDTVEFDKGDTIPRLDCYDALWVMGGPMDVWEEEKFPWLKEEKASGREVILCTASEITVARKIADYVGIFDDVMGSDGVTNLRMEAKGKALAERYGKGQFAYAGNSSHDLKTWPYAGEVIVVNASQSTINALGDQPSIVFE